MRWMLLAEGTAGGGGEDVKSCTKGCVGVASSCAWEDAGVGGGGGGGAASSGTGIVSVAIDRVKQRVGAS